ncbi:hypothetical protein KA057_02235 [Candidatus Gracilibacteria bacterium]|nr:hypothetical protein [Candidatus Gracilibacteria bacterium]
MSPLENQSIPVDYTNLRQGNAELFNKAATEKRQKLTKEEYQDWVFENIQKLPTREFLKLNQDILDSLTAEQRQSMIMAGENKIALMEINSQNEELEKLERIEIAERNIAAIKLRIEGSKKNIAILESEKMKWDLFTDHNESIDVLLEAEYGMLVECERAIKANQLYISNKELVNEIKINKEMYRKVAESADELMKKTQEQANNGAERAKVLHSIAKNIAKGIVAAKTLGNPVAVGATGAAFDSMIGIGDMVTEDKAGDQFVLDIGSSFLSDSLGGGFAKMPLIKSFTEKLGKKLGETAAQIILQKLGSSIIKGGVKTGSNVLTFLDVWNEVEKALPPDITIEEKLQIKDTFERELGADLAGFAETTGIELIRSTIPGGKEAAGIVLGGTGKEIVKKILQ